MTELTVSRFLLDVPTIIYKYCWHEMSTRRIFIHSHFLCVAQDPRLTLSLMEVMRLNTKSTSRYWAFRVRLGGLALCQC
jgi:hypothetical protein